jgi:chaperonin GroEL (HSP60 family)
VELAKRLREYAKQREGREQLAIQAFAEAMEVIPRTLAENAGLDPLDVLARLRKEHELGNRWMGINVFDGMVMDAWNVGVIEPLKIKTQALSSAAEVAEMILRIDDVIVGGKAEGRMAQQMREME